MTFAQPFRDYEILDRVGAGAMGTVFKARHAKLSRIVAIKVLRPSLARDTRYVERLRREARIVAALNHPNIVTGYDLGEEGGYHYFVMEFVEGRSLRALLAEWGIFPEEQVRNVAMQVALALDHAFQKSVIHRDIKPGNILIDEAGAVKVTDMGLAKGPADLTLTRDGSTVGTPQYISPEQAKNPQEVDIRSDLYSLGATLYHMATGQPPFQGVSMAEVIAQVLHETPISPRVINPELSEGMSLVIRKLLSKSPRLRYQTPRELIDDLERLARDQRPQVDEARLAIGESGKRPRAARWAAFAALALALVGGGFWLGARGAQEPGTVPQGDGFVAQLEAELQTLETPGQRWLRFLQRTQEAPTGIAGWRQETQRRLAADLQAALETFLVELRGPGLARIVAEAEDPQRWPPGASLARDHVTGPLARTLGLSRDQLPASVESRALDAQITEIEELVRRRDQSLAERARLHLDVDTPMRADERLRQGDFVGAERVWREGFLGFFDGLRHPLPDRVPALLRTPIEERFERARTQGLQQVDVAEQRAAVALRREAEEGIASLRARDADAGSSPRAFSERVASIARLREQLLAAYPSSSRFRASNDPWREVTALLASFERQLQAAFADSERAHEEQWADLAWRAFLDGDAAAGLAVLAGARERGAAEVDWLEPHRAAMRAASAVADSVVAALQAAPPPIPGYPRNGGVPVELRALPGARLEARVGAGAWRTAQLFEFRFGDLWRRAQEAGPDSLGSVDEEQRRLGRTVLAMACDQLETLADELPSSQRAFLRDEVWPRLLRVRQQSTGSGEERAEALQRLRDALQRGRERGEPREVETALAHWEVAAALQASDAERSVAKEAAQWVARETKRQELLAERKSRAPVGASVEVTGDVEFRTTVRVPPSSMRSAGEGWELRAGRMEHAGAPASWAESVRRKLEVDAGIQASARDVAVECEFALPANARELPLQVFEFRGVACVVFATADGRLHGGVVQGLGKGADAVRSAVERAVHAALDRRSLAPAAIPLALHTLRFATQSAPGRRAFRFVASVDGIELCSAFVDGDTSGPATFAVYPMQDISLRSVRVEAIE